MYANMQPQEAKTVTFSRDCEAIMIPQGDKVMVPKDAQGTITQAMGGSFTLYIQGRLVRVDGKDADAIGEQPVEQPKLPEGATDEDVEALVLEQMKTVFDPEIPINIVDLGLIYKCEFDHSDPKHRKVDIEMTLTAPGCGMGDVLVADVRQRLLQVPTVEEVKVEMVFDPPWSMEHMSEEARLQTGMI